MLKIQKRDVLFIVVCGFLLCISLFLSGKARTVFLLFLLVGVQLFTVIDSYIYKTNIGYMKGRLCGLIISIFFALLTLLDMIRVPY